METKKLIAALALISLACSPSLSQAAGGGMLQARLPTTVARAARQGLVVNTAKTVVKVAASGLVVAPFLFGAALGNDNGLAVASLAAGASLMTISARDLWSRLGWRQNVAQPRRGLGVIFRGLTRASVAAESVPLVPIHLISNLVSEKTSFAERFGK